VPVNQLIPGGKGLAEIRQIKDGINTGRKTNIA